METLAIGVAADGISRDLTDKAGFLLGLLLVVVELVVEIDTNRANASIKSVNSSLSSLEAAAAKSARGASAGIDGLTASMVKGAAAGTVVSAAC